MHRGRGIMNTRREKNPQRKEALRDEGNVDYNSPEFKQTFIDYIRYGDVDNIDEPYLKQIKVKYEQIRRSLPPRAEAFLSKAIDSYIESSYIRPKTKNLDKVYEKGNIQVFVDTENVEGDFSPTSYNMRMVRYGVNRMLDHNKDILPNRKANIIVTDLSKNKHTKAKMESFPEASAMQANKTIFIDWRHIEEPENFIHEYAHHVADLIPTQSEELLIKAYKDLLDMYFRSAKRKKVDPSEITDKMRQQIARKLNFPEYGLTDHHELFAIIIEFWKKFPNNSATYRFKSLVKKVLTRV